MCANLFQFQIYTYCLIIVDDLTFVYILIENYQGALKIIRVECHSNSYLYLQCITAFDENFNELEIMNGFHIVTLYFFHIEIFEFKQDLKYEKTNFFGAIAYFRNS